MATRPAATAPPPIAELNRLPTDAFAQALAPLFEGAPAFLARLAADRPYRSYADLFERARAIALAMPEPEQIELIDAHPRIGADPGSVSELSYREQGYDRELSGADVAREHLAAQLGWLNAAYEARFGFRFVIFVARRPKEAILPIMEACLEADRDEEIRRALGDVVVIAADRWDKLNRRPPPQASADRRGRRSATAMP